MKYKIVLIFVVIICLIMGVFLFSSEFNNIPSEFKDMGFVSDFNNDWINKNLTVNRTDEYTVLSSSSNSSQWYIANKTINNNCVIEWDNYGKPNRFDFCLISDTNMTKDTAINFINNLNIKQDCHVKLVIFNDTIIPYVDGVVKTPLTLQTDNTESLMFRFQINPNGADIRYSNFTIYEN